jgi:long-chain acyl-CoA synthetase
VRVTERQPATLIPDVDPAATAVTAAGGSLTWAELESRATRVANALERDGVEVGGHWAVLLHNRIEWPELIMGNARAGTRYVPLNWHLTPGELAELLIDSGARLIVTERSLHDAAVAAAEIASVSRIITIGDDYEDWLATAGDEPPTERQVGTPLMYTGGTTGRSKGVNRSDRVADAGDWRNFGVGWGRLVRMPSEGRTLATTPLYHALGYAALAASLASGVPVVIEPKFSPEGTLASIERHGITSMAMVPTQFVRLLKLDEEIRGRYDLSSVRWVLHTAAPCPDWAKRAMIDWWGPVIYEMYGSSEGAGPAICDSHEWLAHPGTVGKATVVLEYSTVDDDGHDPPPGEVGAPYAKHVGWLDDEGFLYLADRRVDLIITGGSNVYPAEIEAVLVEHPQVGDAAVFGIPDPDWGQQIKAVVEPADPEAGVDIDSLRTFAAERLASFKLPKSFDVIDQLPREAHGKLKKRYLRDPYWE